MQLIEGAILTEMRTGAASACAVRALAPTPPSILCIVGTGVQARSHIEALRVHHTFTEVEGAYTYGRRQGLG